MVAAGSGATEVVSSGADVSGGSVVNVVGAALVVDDDVDVLVLVVEVVGAEVDDVVVVLASVVTGGDVSSVGWVAASVLALHAAAMSPPARVRNRARARRGRQDETMRRGYRGTPAPAPSGEAGDELGERLAEVA